MQRIVFCDFDGTITQEETFVAMLRRFTPELAAQLLPEIYTQRLTLRDGVRQLVSSIPSTRYSEIIDFTRLQPLRTGLIELLNFLDTNQIPFVVISGGFRGMVEAVVEPFQHRIAAIYAMDVDLQNTHLRVNSAYEGGTEVVAKAQIMAKYRADEAIIIGDSITDLQMALAADLVFARPPLTKYLAEQQKAYIPWQDFIDVRNYLAEYILKGIPAENL